MIKIFFVVITLHLLCIFNQSVVAEKVQQGQETRLKDGDLRSSFLLVCDSVVTRINNAESKVDYFIDSYGVRGLCVAYDMTGKQEYLDACISWSERMAAYQEKMIPAGVYYMNYERKPGEEKGGWFVADGSCIAMGVLTTAVRCKGTEKKQLLQSVEKFATLVMENYLGPLGGVCNGGWSDFKGEWWCSSGLFGSLSFMLYETTGSKKYLETGLRDIDWSNKQDLTKAIPFPLSEQGPSMPMYFLEVYSAGMPYLNADKALKKTAQAKVEWCLDWIKNQQQVSLKDRKWAPTEWWGSKFGGLPFHQYLFSKCLPENGNLKNAADQELAKLTKVIFSKNLFDAQITMFMMLSYAERLLPGNVYKMK